MPERIIIKASRADLPLLRDRYPFIYLEHGRLEIDDSSVKWISAEREIFRIPAATISALLLGPGTSITHEAVKVLAEYLACIARQFLPRAHGGVSMENSSILTGKTSSP